MNKILIAVDDTVSTRDIFSKSMHICKCMAPDEIILLYVERLSGPSILSEMGTDAEMSTLKEVLAGTTFKQALDAKAKKILDYYKNALAEKPPVPKVRAMVKHGKVAEQIVETAKEEDVAMILIGSKGQRVTSLFIGSVSREVVNTADRPVLLVK
jgi:nucleotide-binding universal stress UspA family protein